MSTWKINAINTVGTISNVTPDYFIEILGIKKTGVIVASRFGFFSKKYKYFTSLDGLYFCCISNNSIDIPDGFDVIVSNKIYVPKFLG